MGVGEKISILIHPDDKQVQLAFKTIFQNKKLDIKRSMCDCYFEFCLHSNVVIR